MQIADYASVFSLWSETQGIELTDDDNEEKITLYLHRNPSTCFVAIKDGEIVGCVLCGHDGRRGILRHLAVRSDSRRMGIASSLIEKCLDALRVLGIQKCNIFVLKDNTAGAEFWDHLGWRYLEDNYKTMQHPIS